MRSDPPPLLPILRSRTQAGVLTVLLLNPDLELTQTELARRVGASLSSVVDEVRRLDQAGLLSSRMLGRARLVRAGSGPLVEALAELMLRAFGPLQIIAEEFGAAVAELDEAVIELALFGSWAARYCGEPGAEPADLDVLVVVTSGGLDRGPLYTAADALHRRHALHRRRQGPGAARPSGQSHGHYHRTVGTARHGGGPVRRRDSLPADRAGVSSEQGVGLR
jgi:hypothetical protein